MTRKTTTQSEMKHIQKEKEPERHAVVDFCAAVVFIKCMWRIRNLLCTLCQNEKKTESKELGTLLKWWWWWWAASCIWCGVRVCVCVIWFCSYPLFWAHHHLFGSKFFIFFSSLFLLKWAKKSNRNKNKRKKRLNVRAHIQTYTHSHTHIGLNRLVHAV